MPLNLNRILATAALSTLTLASGAVAQSGAEGAFTVHNATEGNIIVGFYVSTDLETFSENWLSEPMMPGASGSAAFFADSGDCINYFLVGWLGSDQETEVLDEPIEIDICEASAVYLGDNEIFFE